VERVVAKRGEDRGGTDRVRQGDHIFTATSADLPTSLTQQLDEIEDEVHERPTSF